MDTLFSFPVMIYEFVSVNEITKRRRNISDIHLDARDNKFFFLHLFNVLQILFYTLITFLSRVCVIF